MPIDWSLFSVPYSRIASEFMNLLKLRAEMS